ncbi:MAG TPA: cupin domain-containing protein [Candidatus Eremiobacteraceae bacterium]|nr:cupin domain-containing protein [Candidatus Eremiobacteraceae bacterium]
MQPTVIPGVFMWSVWQPARRVYFNSFFLTVPDGNVIVDPLVLLPEQSAEIAERGGAAWVIVTNRDHERMAREVASQFGAKIAAGKGDAPLLSGPVDRLLDDGDEPFAGARVVAFEGLKSPGEIALYLREHDAAIVGDAFWGDPAGSVRMLDDDKLLDPRAAVLSLRKLWALRLTALLVGDGACLFADADRAIGDCLQARTDVFVNRINIDEVRVKHHDDPPGYKASTYELGDPIGARKLGYWIAELPPGNKFCPLHSHSLEEEMFLVWEGRPTIRTPRGSFECRPGDVIAFPVGDVGGHQLLNLSDKPCKVLLLGLDEAHDVCHYPDSDKVSIPIRHLRLRGSPHLDYYDGE